MNPTILRRAVWLVAALALAYAAFAYWYWRPTELVVAVGVLAVSFVADIGLRHEERVERGQSPFGPVAKWGLRK